MYVYNTNITIKKLSHHEMISEMLVKLYGRVDYSVKFACICVVVFYTTTIQRKNAYFLPEKETGKGENRYLSLYFAHVVFTWFLVIKYLPVILLAIFARKNQFQEKKRKRRRLTVTSGVWETERMRERACDCVSAYIFVLMLMGNGTDLSYISFLLFFLKFIAGGGISSYQLTAV